MSDPSTEQESQESKARDFADQALEETPGIVQEFVDFLRYNKKWWMAPIIVVLLLVGLLIILASSGAAPFLYTIF